MQPVCVLVLPQSLFQIGRTHQSYGEIASVSSAIDLLGIQLFLCLLVDAHHVSKYINYISLQWLSLCNSVS